MIAAWLAEGAGYVGVAGDRAQVLVAAGRGGGEGEGAGVHAVAGAAEEPQRPPGKDGAAVIIGPGELAAPSGMTTTPWADSASALTSSTLTCAPAGGDGGIGHPRDAERPAGPTPRWRCKW